MNIMKWTLSKKINYKKWHIELHTGNFLVDEKPFLMVEGGISVLHLSKGRNKKIMPKINLIDISLTIKWIDQAMLVFAITRWKLIAWVVCTWAEKNKWISSFFSYFLFYSFLTQKMLCSCWGDKTSLFIRKWSCSMFLLIVNSVFL